MHLSSITDDLNSQAIILFAWAASTAGTSRTSLFSTWHLFSTNYAF